MRAMFLPEFLLIVSAAFGQIGEVPPIVIETRLRDPLFDVSVARGQFGDNVAEFRRVLGSEKDRRKPAKKIEQNIDTFLRYLRTVSRDRPSFKPSVEQKNLTLLELAAQALDLAVRLRPDIQKMAKAESRAVVPVSHWEFLSALQADLLRLKWMIGRLH